MSSFDGCLAVTPRGFVGLHARSSVVWCRAIATTLRDLGCAFARVGGPLVCLGGTVERLSSTSFRRLRCIGGSEGALSGLRAPVLGVCGFSVQFSGAMTGSLPAFSCLRGSRHRCRTRLDGEACASLHPFSRPQMRDLDNLSVWRVSEDDQSFRWSGQRSGLLALPEILARPLRAVWLNDPDRLSDMKLRIGAVRHFR